MTSGASCEFLFELRQQAHAARATPGISGKRAGPVSTGALYSEYCDLMTLRSGIARLHGILARCASWRDELDTVVEDQLGPIDATLNELEWEISARTATSLAQLKIKCAIIARLCADHPDDLSRALALSLTQDVMRLCPDRQAV
jgi:hypothetical protein